MGQEVRRIPLEGVHNTRDLGGYLTEDGRRIRPRRLIRSGALYGLTEKDKRILTEEYDLRTVVDFRTETEREEKPDPALRGVTFIANPILEEAALGITREEESDNSVAGMVLHRLKRDENAGIRYMESIYGNLITDRFSQKQYGNFFRLLLEQKEGAVLWHCTAGKDRVGTGTALLLSALGVARKQVIADYMKVNEFNAEDIDRMVKGIAKKTGDAALAEQLRILFSVHESYIGTVFERIEKEYGTVERYLAEAMDFPRDAADALKEKYLQ